MKVSWHATYDGPALRYGEAEITVEENQPLIACVSNRLKNEIIKSYEYKKGSPGWIYVPCFKAWYPWK